MRNTIPLSVTLVLGFLALLFIGIVFVRDKLYRTLYNPSRRCKKPSTRIFSEYYLLPNDRECRWVLSPESSEIELIHVWHLDKFSGARTVLYFHGNSDNITKRYFFVSVCEQLGLNLLLVEYRGYGKSPGDPHPTTIIEDAQTAYSFLRQWYDPDEIIVWGESLGGTPALYVAAHHPVHSLVLFSTFSRLEKLLPQNYGSVVHNFIKFACMDVMSRTQNSEFAKKVKCPTLLIHSREDTLIPYDHAKELKKALGGSSSRELFTISGDHGSPVVTRDLVEKLKSYLDIEVEDSAAERVVEILSEALKARK